MNIVIPNFECMKYLKNLLPLLFIIAFQGANVKASNLPKTNDFLEALLNSHKLNASVVKGSVNDKTTGEILIGASVVIKGTVKGDAVNVDGEFTIRGVSAGDHVLVVSYLGYQRKEVPITVTDGSDFNITIEMLPQSVEGEEVVVTAQARGQISAINEQRSSNTITNIVSKDRIEDVPDVNAAESIGRLPGVSIQRSGGEANKVAIRGLSPKFNNVTINGVRVPSVGATDRGVDLSLISSNMLDGIEVSKANTADMDADAIGGSINLRLRTAPDEFYTDFRLQGGYTALQREYGNYKFVGSAGDRFLNDKLGVILNLNIDRYDRSADTFNGSYEIRPNPQNNGFPTPTILGLDLNESALTRSRLGGSAIVDYKLNNGKIIANVISNQLQNDGFRRTNSFSTINKTHSYELSEFERETSIITYSLNVEQDYNWFSYDLGASFATSDNDSPNELNWEYREDGAVPGGSLSNDILFGDPENIPPLYVNEIANTHLNSLNVVSQKTTEDELTLSANLKFPFQLGSKISGYLKTGAKIRSKDRFNDRESLASNDLRFGGGQNARAAIANAIPELGLASDGSDRIPLSPILDDYSRSNFLNGDYPLGYTLQPNLLRRMTLALQANNFLLYDGSASLGSDYEGEEKYNAFYLMGEINLGDFTLIPGARYEAEETTYKAKFVPPSTVTAGQVPNFTDTSSTRKDEFLLPMIHLKYAPAKWLSVRAAYTQTLSRPDFSQYAPNTYIFPQGGFVNAPNVNLKNSISTNYDLSVSLYQNKLGFFTVSGFYKEIDDLIRFVRFPLLEGQSLLPELDFKGFVTGQPIINTYVNNENPAYVKGIELDWQTNFWYLPSILKGLVLNVNLTLLKSETDYPSFYTENVPISPRPPSPPFNELVLRDTSYTARIPDQASSIANVTVGYDFKGFSGRVSFYYQNESFTGNFGSRGFEINSSGEKLFVTGDDVFTDALYRIDMSLKQKITENIEIYSNLNNLTNEFDQNFQSDFSVNPTFIQYYGFTMDVGVRARF